MNGDQAPIPQAVLHDLLMPVLRERGKRYRKFKHVLARPATAGEVVVSRTSSGTETRNTASQGDVVVKNSTEAGEAYIVAGNKFSARYTLIAGSENGWNQYRPRGEVFALEINAAVLRKLERSSRFEIEAPWGEPQRAEPNDFLATPPEFSEIYRIARREFFQTYQLVTVLDDQLS